MYRILAVALVILLAIGCAEQPKPRRLPGSVIYGDRPRPAAVPKKDGTSRTEKSRTTVTPKAVINESVTETTTLRKARDGSRSLTILRTYQRREKPRRPITPYHRTGTRPRVPLPPAPPVH